MPADRIKLAYEEYGNPANPTVIILHGFFASSRNWRQIARKMEENFHVLIPDLRNHGSSPHTPQMSYPEMADDLAVYMDQQGLTMASLLGHSMGGKVAMWFALHQPERVEKLVIVDIAPVSYPHSFNSMIKALISLPVAELSGRSQAEKFLSEEIPELGFRQFLLQNLVLLGGVYRWKINLETFYQSSPVIVAFPETDSSTVYNRKVLFVAGENSNYITPDYVDTVFSLFPSSIVKEIPGAGHWVHAESPGLFTEMVTRFLKA